MNYGAEDRLAANALVTRVLGQIDGYTINDARGRDAGIRHVLYAAADILVEAARSGQTAPAGDDLLRASLARAEWTPKKWARATKAARALVEDAIRMMVEELWPSPDGPDGDRADIPDAAGQEHPDELVAVTLRDMERIGYAEGAIVSKAPVLMRLLRCSAGLVTEAARSGRPVGGDAASTAAVVDRARAELGMTEVAFARIPLRGRIALETAVYFANERCRALAQQAKSDAETAEQEEIDRAVGSVLRQYRHNAGTLGPAAADSWAEADIAREASRIAPPLPDSRHPDWQRVHDAIRRKFNRFVMHVPDDEKLTDGDYQVWIKGWDCWVPARIEREGLTWKLPIGRVSAVGIDDIVAAVRPLAA